MWLALMVCTSYLDLRHDDAEQEEFFVRRIELRREAIGENIRDRRREL